MQPSTMVQSPRSVKQPDVPGVDTHGSVVVVDVLVEVLVLLVDVVGDVDVLVLLVEVVSVGCVLGTTTGNGSPHPELRMAVPSASRSGSTLARTGRRFAHEAGRRLMISAQVDGLARRHRVRARARRASRGRRMEP